MRILYSFLFYLILPFLFLRLLWRSRQLPEYRYRLKERLGFYPFKLEKTIWIHAVSVGETLAAIPLIKLLKQNNPHAPILVTTMTPTGAARVKSAFGNEVFHVYIPYDLPDAVQRFLNAMQPTMAIFMETELWPNLLGQCHSRKIPIYLMNARLSEKSARGYRKVSSLTYKMLQQITLIAANSENDAKRFVALGAGKNKVQVTGNIKFDLELPADLSAKTTQLRSMLGKQRFIWIAASTHEGEEEIILQAHQQLCAMHANALLILVPRHPDRFDAVVKLAQQFFKVQRRTTTNECYVDTHVYIGDTMGELLLLYSAADVTFVGGSLIPRGGHNILEPAALQKPILTGPHVFNFAEITELFFQHKALIKVNNADELTKELMQIVQHANIGHSLGQNAYQVMANNRGALQKQFELLSKSKRQNYVK